MLESTSSLKRPSLLIRWVSGKGMGRIFFVTFLIIGIVFGTSTIEYFFNYNNKPGPVWDKALGLMTSDWFATGKESISQVQRDHFSKHLLSMWIHATTGGLMIMIGPLQFSTKLRQYRPKLHRTLGKIFLVCALVTSLGAFSYLLQSKPTQIFSGIPFSVSLYAMAIGTLAGTVLGYTSIRKGKVHVHRAWLILVYLFALTTPLLRMTWISIFPFFPELNQWDNNLASGMVIIMLISVSAPLWLSIIRIREAKKRGRLNIQNSRSALNIRVSA